MGQEWRKLCKVATFKWGTITSFSLHWVLYKPTPSCLPYVNINNMSVILLFPQIWSFLCSILQSFFPRTPLFLCENIPVYKHAHTRPYRDNVIRLDLPENNLNRYGLLRIHDAGRFCIDILTLNGFLNRQSSEILIQFLHLWIDQGPNLNHFWFKNFSKPHTRTMLD